MTSSVVYCMHEADGTLVDPLTYFKLINITCQKKKQSAWRTVSKPILPPSSSPSCYFAFQNIYFVRLYTKIPDFVIREKQKCEKIVFIAIRCRYVQIVESLTIFIAYFHLRLLQWETSNACWLWLLAKISQPFFSFYLSDVFYGHSHVNLFIHH